MRASRELDEMTARLSMMEQTNADLTDEREPAGAKEQEVPRQRGKAGAARERALREQRDKAEARVRVLEKQVSELHLQRAEMERELQVTRCAMKRVEGNLNALWSRQRRARAANSRRAGKPSARA